MLFNHAKKIKKAKKLLIKKPIFVVVKYEEVTLLYQQN
jgi:hypothetical protein